jgi:uncharacterized protein (UPF0147 family)
MSTNFTGVSRKTHQLYRDCLRLIDHIAGKSVKGQNIRRIVRQEFRKNSHLTDLAHIESCKAMAIRGLSNYLMLESASKDTKFQQRVNKFAEDEKISVQSERDKESK